MPLWVRVRVEVPTTTDGSESKVTSLVVRVAAPARLRGMAASSPTMARVISSLRFTSSFLPWRRTGREGSSFAESVALSKLPQRGRFTDDMQGIWQAN
jgi:hypothetical protein